MRSESSIKNAITAIGSNIISILIGIISQAVFIKVLGTEYCLPILYLCLVSLNLV